MKNLNILRSTLFVVMAALMSSSKINAQNLQAEDRSLFGAYDTEEVSMMRSVTKRFKNGWSVDPILTVAETNNEGIDYNEERFGYRVPGVFDGMYAFGFGRSNRIDLYVNHELQDSRGYPYQLDNGTTLTGARVTKFRVVEDFRGNRGVQSAQLAYGKIYDRYYNMVTDPSQLNEGANPGSLDGMDRLCSANGIERNKFGFRDDIFFTGEETGPPFDARGGQEFVLDVRGETLYCAPAMGRAAWESVCVMDNFRTNKVAVLVGDDRQAAPLLLYIGEKRSSFSPNAPRFLIDNGLAKGYLYVWVSDNGDRDPEAWNGTGTTRSGKFIRIDHYNPSLAGQDGWDNEGWADILTQDALAEDVGYFKFSRPEDLHTNPNDGTQAIFASTGRPALFPSDSWGTTYLIDIEDAAMQGALRGSLEDINNIPAEMTILYDGDDAGAGQFEGPDYGLRSPDNLVWAEDGYAYINEDRSIGDFCSESAYEASVWQLNPNNGDLTRILEMDRTAVPFMQEDRDPDDCGDWESSGTIDVSKFFRSGINQTVLLLNVQAHSIDGSVNDDIIGGDEGPNALSEGGQLLFATKQVSSVAKEPRNADYGYYQEESKISKPIDTFNAYPNPATNVVTLNKKANIRVFDTIGYMVFEGSDVKSFNVSNLKPGIYFIKTDNDETQKIIIK